MYSIVKCLLIVSFFLSVFGFDTEENYYKINLIIDKGKFYVIHASLNNKRYLIISDKDSKPATGKRVVLGRTYYLKLTCIYPFASVDGTPFIDNLTTGVAYGNKIIRLKSRYRYRVYHADNLQGLYLCDGP